MRPEHYSDLYRNFAAYLRNFGDTKFFLIACGPNSNDVQWTRGVLEGFRRQIPNGIAMRYYSSGSDAPTNFTPQHMNDQF